MHGGGARSDFAAAAKTPVPSARMATVDFHAQSRAAQDRLRGALAGTDPPTPLARRLGAPARHLPGLLACVAGLAGLVGIAVVGFGATTGEAVQPKPFTAGYVALGALAVFGLLDAIARKRAVRVLPYAPGVYVFSRVVVDARSDVLEVVPLSELKPSASGRDLHLRGSTSFDFPGEAGALGAIEAALAEPVGDDKHENPKNPLGEPLMPSPLAPTDPFERHVPRWARLRLLLALAIGGAAGFGLYTVRNKASDDRAFDAAKRADTVEGWNAYLQSGLRHAEMVKQSLLPRAELRLAVKKASVDAILDYEKTHPGKIEAEVKAALTDALTRELAAAAKEGTLAALDAFDGKRKGHGLDADLQKARDAVYVAALGKWKARKGTAPEAVTAMAALVGFSQKNKGATVEIRFRRLPSATLGNADKFVTKMPKFNGETSYTSRYFDATHMAAHEEALGKTVVASLSEVFSKEILTAKVGAAIAEGEPPPKVTVPTLLVEYHTEWNTTAYSSDKPRGIVCGVLVKWSVTFHVPPSTSWRTALEFTGTPSMKQILGWANKPYPKPGEMEEDIYSAIRKAAFEGIEGKIVGALFGTP